jgi:hypothetical protein
LGYRLSSGKLLTESTGRCRSDDVDADAGCQTKNGAARGRAVGVSRQAKRLVKQLHRVIKRLQYAPSQGDSDKTPGEDELKR